MVNLTELLYEGYIQPPLNLSQEIINWILTGYTNYTVYLLERKINADKKTISNFEGYEPSIEIKNSIEILRSAITSGRFNENLEFSFHGPLIPIKSKYGEILWKTYEIRISKNKDLEYEAYVYDNDRMIYSLPISHDLKHLDYNLMSLFRSYSIAADEILFVLKINIEKIKKVISDIQFYAKNDISFNFGENIKEFDTELSGWSFLKRIKNISTQIPKNISIRASINRDGKNKAGAVGLFHGLFEKPTITIFIPFMGEFTDYDRFSQIFPFSLQNFL